MSRLGHDRYPSQELMKEKAERSETGQEGCCQPNCEVSAAQTCSAEEAAGVLAGQGVAVLDGPALESCVSTRANKDLEVT